MKPKNMQSPPDPTVEVEPGTLEKVRRLLRCLVKFVQGKKLYAKNNPTLAKFARDFDSALQEFFEEEQELVLNVEKYSLSWRSHVVYENEKRDESIAFNLYKDGVGEISVRQGVPFREVEKLIDIIKDDNRGHPANEDVVTRLWKADFEHIGYRVLDEYLLEEFGDGSRATDDGQIQLASADHPDLPSFADSGRVIVSSSAQVEPITDYLHRLFSRSGSELSGMEREKYFEGMMESFFVVSSEELRLCQEEIHREQEDDTLIQFFDAIVDFTLGSDNGSIVRDVTNVIECIVDYLIEESEVASLDASLSICRRYLERSGTADDTRDFFSRMESKLTESELLMSLAGSLEGAGSDCEEVLSYYRAVGVKAVPTLRRLLDRLSGAKLHREICDALVYVSREDIPTIIDELNLDKPEQARDVVYLVRASGIREVPEVIKQLMHYPDDRVRDEVIGFLAGLGRGDAVVLLSTLLDDPGDHVRSRALVAVEEMADPVLARKVRSIAFGKEISRRNIEEQELVFRVLGKLNGTEALPEIRRMVEKKHVFGLGGSHGKQKKLLAIRALEHIEGAEAREILEQLAEDSNSTVRSRAQRVLGSRERRADSTV